MNTPAHLIFAAAAFARPGQPRLNTATLLGAVLPDLSLYGMVFWNRFVRGLSFDEIFGQSYYSAFWQQVFAIDNSIPLWLMVLAAAIFAKSAVLIGFAGAGCLHLALDLPLHHDDGRMHFWPFSDWIFKSPLSYWDSDHYGGIIGPLEGLVALACLVVLWRRFDNQIGRLLILVGGLLECVPAILFPLMF